MTLINDFDFVSVFEYVVVCTPLLFNLLVVSYLVKLSRYNGQN